MTIQKRPKGRPHATDPLINSTIRLTEEQRAFMKIKGGSKFVRDLISAEMFKSGFEGVNHDCK